MLNKKTRRFTFLLLCIIISLYLFYKSYYFLKIYSWSLNGNGPILNVLVDGEFLKLKSNCFCKKKNLYVLKQSNIVYVQSGSNNVYYNFSDDAYDPAKITCNLYNVFSRGPNQKVIGLSLYGKDPFYYDAIKNISILAKKYYPDWIIRIYYDYTINDKIICELECLKENNLFLNNIDFCDVNKIPFGSNVDSWNALHLHKMMWRWLPIGDSFVDYFMSRDTDSWINKREYDSVQVWLNSKTLFHIMRDNPLHNVPILGGMYGFANVRNRELSKKLFSILIDKKIANRYYKNGVSVKGLDQEFLREFFWEYAQKNSTIHDSYTCKEFQGKPFPTQRPNSFCYVSCIYCCEDNYKHRTNKECPIECRPEDHQNWIYC